MNEDRDNDGGSAHYASPPCFMHELDPDGAGLTPADAQQRIDLVRWRKAERRRQIDLRLSMDLALRRAHAQRIARLLEEAIGGVERLTVSVYWPIRGEPDLRALMARLVQRGGQCALPVVADPDGPLVFRRWAPGERLERGIWNIPVPAGGPVVAFDRACYRLGYGGGYYDRTLAAMPSRPRVLGAGFAQAGVPTIYPQPHDVPMDAIVTEEGVLRRGGC